MKKWLSLSILCLAVGINAEFAQEVSFESGGGFTLPDSSTEGISFVSTSPSSSEHGKPDKAPEPSQIAVGILTLGITSLVALFQNRKKLCK